VLFLHHRLAVGGMSAWRGPPGQPAECDDDADDPEDHPTPLLNQFVTHRTSKQLPSLYSVDGHVFRDSFVPKRTIPHLRDASDPQYATRVVQARAGLVVILRADMDTLPTAGNKGWA